MSADTTLALSAGPQLLMSAHPQLWMLAGPQLLESAIPQCMAVGRCRLAHEMRHCVKSALPVYTEVSD